MFMGSSMDYMRNVLLITFEGEAPSQEDITEFCIANYGQSPDTCDITLPEEFRGMSNLGTIIVTFS